MRGFIATVFLFAGVINGAMLYRPAPVQARPVASWLKTDKVQDRLPVRPVQVEIIPPRIAKLSEPVRLLWPCTLMRLAVEKFGREAVRKALKDNRTAKSEIDEAMMCLKKENT